MNRYVISMLIRGILSGKQNKNKKKTEIRKKEEVKENSKSEFHLAYVKMKLELFLSY